MRFRNIAAIVSLMIVLTYGATPARAVDPQVVGIPVEILMQEVQARYHYLTGGWITWSACCGSDSPATPHYPPAGFYKACVGSESDMRARLDEAAGEIGALMSWPWVDPSWSPGGSSDSYTTHLLTVPSDVSSPSLSNKEYFSALYAFVQKMKVLPVAGTFDLQPRAGFGSALSADVDCGTADATARSAASASFDVVPSSPCYQLGGSPGGPPYFYEHHYTSPNTPPFCDGGAIDGDWKAADDGALWDAWLASIRWSIAVAFYGCDGRVAVAFSEPEPKGNVTGGITGSCG